MKTALLYFVALVCCVGTAAAQVQRLTADQVFSGPVRFTGAITPAQLTANQNDYAPTGLGTANTLRLSSDASRNITGLAAGSTPAGWLLFVENIGSFDLVLVNASASSTAVNRFAFSADITLTAGTGVILKYDVTASRWRALGVSSGGGGGGSTGDVVGPASAVGDRIAVFDLTTGKLIKDGGKTIAEVSPVGSQTIWIPGTAMSPATTNGATAAQTELTAGRPEIAALAFDPTTEKYAQFAVAMPKSWNNGTVTAQFFWAHPATTTNFGVVWSIQGVAVSDADALDAVYGTAQLVTDTGGTTNALYISAATGAVTIGGTPATGDLVYFRIARIVADAGDTMAVAARLIGVKLIYTTSAPTDL